MSLKIVTYLLLVSLILGCGTKIPQASPEIQNSILFSPVPAIIEVFQGTRTIVFLSAIDDNLKSIKFSSQVLENFITIIDFENGSSEVIIDAPMDKEGLFPVQIKLGNGKHSSLISFKIKIKEQTGPVFLCAPMTVHQTEMAINHAPFSSLENLMKSDIEIPSGSLILLLDGVHGSPIIKGNNYTIAAARGQNPTINKILFHQAKKITLSGLRIGKIYETKVKPKTKKFIITIDSLSSNITIQNSLIQIAYDTENWTETDWATKAINGILCQGKNSLIQQNLIRNIFHGIKTENENTKIQYNTIDRFSGDAIRNISNNNTYSFNVLKNAVIDDYYDDEKGNHDDLFQSWTFTHPIENILLENNIAISCLEPDLPLKSKVVQGIVCFDGFEKNWIIRENLVITDHPHGIALFGAENCKVSHNTILRNPLKLFEFESEPWIMINDHKDKRKSIQNVVNSNTISALNIVSSDVKISGNNIIDSTNYKYFVDYKGWDFRPVSVK